MAFRGCQSPRLESEAQTQQPVAVRRIGTTWARGVDRGLRSVDMARSALGHVMFQTETQTGSANAGAAVEKSKLWLTRYESLRELSEWADETCQLLWAGSSNAQGKLLPTVDRG